MICLLQIKLSVKWRDNTKRGGFHMPNMNVLIKPASGLCNLRCTYCFYIDETKNREIESYGFMTEETLEQVIKKTIEGSDTECTIAYQGGEPTLRGLDFFKKSIIFQNEYNTKKIHIHNAIQTNGYDVSDEFLDFLKENNFLVGVSLDGIPYSHDAYRLDAQNKGSFSIVRDAIRRMEERKIEYNILTVVNATTAKKIKQIYEYFKEEGFEYLQFIPCLNPFGEEDVKYPHTLTAKLYSQFLRTLFDLWYQDMMEGKIVHIQQFENYVLMLLGQPPGICGMSGICSYQNVVEADGEVYPCDFYVLDQYKLGNLNEVSLEEVHQKRLELQFVEQSHPIHADCKACKYGPICRGGCRRHREPMIEGEYQKNIFCTAYYEFFEYSIKRLEEIARRYAR